MYNIQKRRKINFFQTDKIAAVKPVDFLSSPAIWPYLIKYLGWDYLFILALVCKQFYGKSGLGANSTPYANLVDKVTIPVSTKCYSDWIIHRRITTLDASFCFNPQAVLGNLWFCQGITTLDLSGTGTKDRDLDALNCLALQELWLNYCNNITIEGFKKLTKKQSETLTSLSLKGNRNIPPSGLVLLSHFEKLQELDLGGTQANHEVVANLPHSVEYLALNGCLGVTDQIWPYLSYRYIQTLVLCGCKINSIFIEPMCNFWFSIQDLDLSETKISHVQYPIVGPKLTELDLSYCGITITTLKKLLGDLHTIRRPGPKLDVYLIMAFPKHVREKLEACYPGITFRL